MPELPDATATPDLSDPDWWKTAVVYQVYPRSFADANGDGIGDLEGIRSRVPYLRELGVDAVWLSPFYPSALADGGYDVDDYRDVDPTIGTLDEFDLLIADLHAAGIRMIVDIVPNHSSNRHPWFLAALAAPKGSPARSRYVFRDGLGDDGELPPSDWPSHFGGPAWTRVPDGQWYLHLFTPEQPDFDWSNPEVREDFHTTLRFWSDRGVDGFRVDVAHALAKDLTEPLRSKTSLEHEFVSEDGKDPLFDRDEVHEIFRGWRSVMNEYDPPRAAVAESWAPVQRRALYARPDELGQTFNFALAEAPWDASEFRAIITESLERADAAGASSTWVLSNHDIVRHASRFALPIDTDLTDWLMSDGTIPIEDLEIGARRARAAILTTLAMPGSTYLYQGEELGLREVADIPPGELQDPIWLRTQHTKKGRDGCRVPLPWTPQGTSFGFGTGRAHLPQPAWFADYAVSTLEADAESILTLYRRALALRKALDTDDTFAWRSVEEGVLDFVRSGPWRVVVNFTDRPTSLPEGEVLLSSAPVESGLLPVDAAAWLRV